MCQLGHKQRRIITPVCHGYNGFPDPKRNLSWSNGTMGACALEQVGVHDNMELSSFTPFFLPSQPCCAMSRAHPGRLLSACTHPSGRRCMHHLLGPRDGGGVICQLNLHAASVHRRAPGLPCHVRPVRYAHMVLPLACCCMVATARGCCRAPCPSVSHKHTCQAPAPGQAWTAQIERVPAIPVMARTQAPLWSNMGTQLDVVPSYRLLVLLSDAAHLAWP